MKYKVSWLIDIEADDPQDAAAQALAIQRRPGSIATVFHVKPEAPGAGGVIVDVDNGETLPWLQAPRDGLETPPLIKTMTYDLLVTGVIVAALYVVVLFFAKHWP